MSEAVLRLTEIFYSLQGESTFTGLPTVFIRLTGCPLRCVYCDTRYAFHGGEKTTLLEILDRVRSFHTPYVTVTGGEPLAQKNCIDLLRRLCDEGYHVSLETSGALEIAAVDPRVVKVMDIKTPGSGEQDKNLLSNLEFIDKADQLKFVIGDEHDYQWAKAFLQTHALQGRCELLFSPCYGSLDAAKLAEWILMDHLPVRFQIQLHKVLWGDQPGR